MWLSRVPLRPLRGSGFALGQPDAFISPGRQAVREADALSGVRGRIPASQNVRSFARPIRLERALLVVLG